MTTIQTVSPAPKPIQDFIRQATPSQRLGYLVKGEPQCIALQTYKNDEFITLYAPGLRGVMVAKPVDTPELAVSTAADRLAEFLMEQLEEVDEIALGIDTEGFDINMKMAEIGCRIEHIFHIGSMVADGTLPEAFRDLINDLASDHAYAKRQPKGAIRRPAIYDELPILPEIFAQPHKARGELDDIFVGACHDAGSYGFIVVVSIPTYHPHANGGARIDLGCRRIEHRYASTFAVACDRAAEWALAEYHKMMAVPAAA